jgi:dihydrofolate synthase/folylpolyglutamate synthase
MRSISTFAEARNALTPFMSTAPVARYTLDRMRSLMDYLGNPQDRLHIVHVAGTSGKTSTSYYCAALIRAAGFSVGLTVSPHIDEINERAQVNLKGLPEKKYCKELNLFLDLVDASTIHPSYFELLVAFAYWLFEKQHVNYAVVEVGLGGLLDGTNVISRNDKICVIADIGYDHTEILGNTLEEIATQKAGIIYPHNEVFMHIQLDEIITTIRNLAEAKEAPLTVISDSTPLLRSHPLFLALPDFQKRNFSLAYVATASITGPLSPEALNQALETVVPARMETVQWNNKTFIMDGSHNEQKLAALVQAVRKKYKAKDIALLVAFGENKFDHLEANLKLLRTISSHITITTFKNNQDQPRKAIDPLKIMSYAKESGFHSITIEANAAKALDLLAHTPESVVVITGSFYLLNSVRSLILSKS